MSGASEIQTGRDHESTGNGFVSALEEQKIPSGNSQAKSQLARRIIPYD
jgi:hypothetical protein